MADYRHILYVHFEIPLGGAVIATATLRSLKESNPSLKVSVVASGHSLDLMAASPYVHKLHAAPNPIKSPLLAFLYAATKIFPERKEYDAIVLDYGNRRSLITVFAILTGIKERIGYSVRPCLLHSRAHHNSNDSNIARNNKALAKLTRNPLKETEPSIHFCHNDIDIYDSFFSRYSEARPRVVFVTETSKGHPNAWYADRFVMVGKLLISQYDALVILIGTAANKEDINNIRQGIGHDSVSLAGQTSPRQLAALMACCDFCISADTGAMHVARAVTLPTVILGNAAQPVGLWLPPAGLDYIELIRKDHLPCTICWKLKCETKECMDEISVEDVESAFLRLKSRVSWGKEARKQRVLDFSS
ncbi:glycosyltransferase family 9 protein [Synechococcus sp. CBW1002]|uniref:glycosyltransferase family 9 protein n=1 Tax=Synechococcus sp. CBW1002 TaxID=1353134 RepID=UPI0018CF4AC4|nr:glycosyltransferase family 9 protein [Synechococcus sp. CBW1002]QPN59132.1 glycosyltransferase family 9 protein [Synechococcus sp. CBW1002]